MLAIRPVNYKRWEDEHGFFQSKNCCLTITTTLVFLSCCIRNLHWKSSSINLPLCDSRKFCHPRCVNQEICCTKWSLGVLTRVLDIIHDCKTSLKTICLRDMPILPAGNVQSNRAPIHHDRFKSSAVFQGIEATFDNHSHIGYLDDTSNDPCLLIQPKSNDDNSYQSNRIILDKKTSKWSTKVWCRQRVKQKYADVVS